MPEPRQSPDREEWKIDWIADHLAWRGQPRRIERSRLYEFPDGRRVYFENRNRNQSVHYWIRISEENCKKLWNDIGFCHVIFIDNAARAIVLLEETLRELRPTISQNDPPALDLSIYPDDGFRVQGKQYQGNWAPFVVGTELISDLDRHRRATTSFRATTVPPNGQAVVQTTFEQVRRFKRSIPVSAWVLSQASGKCEACQCDAPFFDVKGIPFLEVHHLKPLADGGPDTPDNTIAICPNCHRKLHYGRDAQIFREELIQRISRLKSY